MNKTESNVQKRKHRWYLIVGLLSLMVIVSSAAALMIPALTMSAQCGLEEHQHSELCYAEQKLCEYGKDTDKAGDKVLICGQEEKEGLHKHTETCYHTHTKECFSHAPLKKTCDFGKRTDEVGDKVLICGQVEKEGVHKHTEACYHIHTEECFESTLICTIPEHTHTEACYIKTSNMKAEGATTEEVGVDGQAKKDSQAQDGVQSGAEVDAKKETQINLYMESNRKATFDDIQFANLSASTPTPSSVKVTLEAKKTLDGKEPGADKTFRFQLFDSKGTLLQTKENDAYGNVVFDDLTFTEAGNYNFTIKEINDGQGGISYDTKAQEVTIKVTETSSGTATNFDFNASPYYSLTSDGTDDSRKFYLSKNKGGTDLAAYCIDASKDFPPLAHDLITGYDSTKYSVIQNPSNTTLENNVGLVKYSGKTEENLKKLLYYLDQHPELSSQKKNALVWTATSEAADFYTSVSQSELNQIYENTTVPSNYRLALFYPSELGGSRTGVTLDSYQPLLTGYYTDETVLSAEYPRQEDLVFTNTTNVSSGYKLPSTGGRGVYFASFIGMLFMGGAVMLYVLINRQRRGR